MNKSKDYKTKHKITLTKSLLWNRRKVNFLTETSWSNRFRPSKIHENRKTYFRKKKNFQQRFISRHVNLKDFSFSHFTLQSSCKKVCSNNHKFCYQTHQTCHFQTMQRNTKKKTGNRMQKRCILTKKRVKRNELQKLWWFWVCTGIFLFSRGTEGIEQKENHFCYQTLNEFLFRIMTGKRIFFITVASSSWQKLWTKKWNIYYAKFRNVCFWCFFLTFLRSFYNKTWNQIFSIKQEIGMQKCMKWNAKKSRFVSFSIK